MAGRQREGRRCPRTAPPAPSSAHTVGDGLHGDARGVLAVPLLVELHHGAPAVALRRVQRVEAARVGAQLLHRSRTERVTGGNEDAEAVLDEPERDLQEATDQKSLLVATQPDPVTPLLSYLGQVGGFPDTVDTTKGYDVGPAMALGIHDITENIHTALGLQDLHQGLLQCLLHRRGHRWEKGMERGSGMHGEYSRAPNHMQDATWTLTGERSHHLPFQFLGHRFTELHCNFSCHIFSFEEDRTGNQCC